MTRQHLLNITQKTVCPVDSCMRTAQRGHILCSHHWFCLDPKRKREWRELGEIPLFDSKVRKLHDLIIYELNQQEITHGKSAPSDEGIQRSQSG